MFNISLKPAKHNNSFWAQSILEQIRTSSYILRYLKPPQTSGLRAYTYMSTYSACYICRTKCRALFVALAWLVLCRISTTIVVPSASSAHLGSARIPHWHWVSYPSFPPPPALRPLLLDSFLLAGTVLGTVCLSTLCKATRGRDNLALRLCYLFEELMLSWLPLLCSASTSAVCLTTTEMEMARAKAATTTTTITMRAFYSSRQTQSKCPKSETKS